MEKLIRDGQVAVAVSYGFGAGWSTWNSVSPLDGRFNQLFLDGKIDEIIRICEEEDLGYAGGAEDVEIVWLPEGTEFVIDEYDGNEGLELKEETDWLVA